MVLVSHDRRLIEATADRLLLVADGEVAPFEGDLDDYRRFLLSGETVPDDARPRRAPSRPRKTRGARRRERRRQLKPLKDKIDAAEHQIAALTAELAKLDAALADPLLFTHDPAKGTAVSKKRADAARKLAAAEATLAQGAGRIRKGDGTARKIRQNLPPSVGDSHGRSSMSSCYSRSSLRWRSRICSPSVARLHPRWPASLFMVPCVLDGECTCRPHNELDFVLGSAPAAELERGNDLLHFSVGFRDLPASGFGLPRNSVRRNDRPACLPCATGTASSTGSIRRLDRGRSRRELH